MQRLKTLFKWRKNNDDRGASAVIVALMMVPIMILAALAIDVAAMHADRQQLQTGADSGALAIAQDCARDDCSTTGATAQSMAAANLNAAGALGEVHALDETAGEVRVQTSTVRDHWFAPIIGINSTPLQAQSAARWGYPTGGTAVLPLTFSWCALTAQAGITVQRDPSSGAVIGVDIPESTPDRTINFTKSSDTSCTGPSGNALPGGFGWLSPSAESCGKTESIINGWVGSDTGNNVPSICNDAEFRKWIGKTVLLPIFDRTTGTGNNGEYLIYGYAAFTLSGYYFAGQYGHPSPAPCGGNERCIRGSFDRFVDLTEDFDYSPSGPRLGAAVVALTE
ncbi:MULTISPECIES: TadE/TadG family type IV pilus assembly protein [unclassified Nesterenkonia]|uniref:TadE/TadG family type IV pilus assembly protein n=1 Tax=unclassified Nesterenkonia TaxID=2629769 RepID=UPI001F4C9F9B|nr:MULTISPECIES: Tad domain-containing protein [unclassified Nesterenkonia]MCH8560942.1 Tad domain-containing protein [Nesterenkonia sp. DZ6]MCH8571022.1 Tad domain-containing protein [Nesterenkonia sp. AY15]